MDRLRNRLQGRGERGSILVEVLVSGFVLSVGIAGLFGVLDTSSAATGASRAASVAAALAESDQERLRSFRVPQLSNRNETRTVPVDGRSYVVVSRGDWIRDSTGGTVSCANDSSQADYLRITSTVTPPAGTGGQPKPVEIRSLIAPPVGVFGPGQGTLAVKTTGADGSPVQGANVQINGTTSLSSPTNELGCAVFGYVPIGPYAVQASAPGYVDPAGNPSATGTATVTENTVNLTELQLDQAASVIVKFDTQLPGGLVQPATSTQISAANDAVPGTGAGCKLDTGYRLYPSGPAGSACPATPQGSITATGLYPYPSPYTFYSGSCPANNPANYDPNYFSSVLGSAVLTPGSNTTLTVREPSLNLAVNASVAGIGVHVRVKSVDPGCNQSYDWNLLSLGTNPPSVTLPDPGLPFGHYDVCAEVGVGALARRRTLSNVALTSPAGSGALNLDLRSGTTGGTCP